MDNEILSIEQIIEHVGRAVDATYILARGAPHAGEIRNHLADIRGLMGKLKLALES